MHNFIVPGQIRAELLWKTMTPIVRVLKIFRELICI